MKFVYLNLRSDLNTKGLNIPPKISRHRNVNKEMTSRGEREELETVLGESKALADLLKSLQENLVKVSDKNENLLEAIESSEARAGQSTSGEV